MDFVVGLPKNLGKYDSIWVIVDRLTKSAHFIPVKLTYNAEKLARIYISEIVRLHGVPLSIISNRGTQFMSRPRSGPRLAPTLTLLCERTNQWETYIFSHIVPQMGPYQCLSDSYCCRRTLLRVRSYPNDHQILSHMHEAYPPTLESFAQTDHRSEDGTQY